MSNRQTKEETDRSLGIAPNSAAQDRDRALIEELAWLHKFINCVPFGEGAPQSDIQRAHKIVERLAHEQQHDRIERDAQDAKRYRWLRIMWWNFGSSNYPVPSKFGGKEFWSHLDAFAAVDTPDKLNAAIDAAIGAADEGGE